MFFHFLKKNCAYCFILLIFVISAYKNFINKALTQRQNLHIFINDAFYYSLSKSLGSDTVAVLFSGHKFMDDIPFSCYSTNNASTALTTKPRWYRALEAPPQCKWTIYVVLCPVIKEVENFYITSEQGVSEKVFLALF